MPECSWLDDEETLTYLHSTISTKRQRVRVPEIPMYLDALLADQPLTGGLEPMLGQCASARADGRRVSDRHDPRDSGRAQPAGLPLSLVDPRDHARQDRCNQAADQNPPAMVRQAQVDRRDPEGGDDQRGLDACSTPTPTTRRSTPTRRCRSSAPTRSAKPLSPPRSRSGTTIPALPTKSSAWSRRSSRDATSPACGDASMRSRPGSASCPAMSMPMSASRRSRRSTSRT